VEEEEERRRRRQRQMRTFRCVLVSISVKYDKYELET
jgi:hypothetical protein